MSICQVTQEEEIVVEAILATKIINIIGDRLIANDKPVTINPNFMRFANGDRYVIYFG